MFLINSLYFHVASMNPLIIITTIIIVVIIINSYKSTLTSRSQV